MAKKTIYETAEKGREAVAAKKAATTIAGTATSSSGAAVAAAPVFLLVFFALIFFIVIAGAPVSSPSRQGRNPECNRKPSCLISHEQGA